MVGFYPKGECNGVFFIGKESSSDIRIVGEGQRAVGEQFIPVWFVFASA